VCGIRKRPALLVNQLESLPKWSAATFEVTHFSMCLFLHSPQFHLPLIKELTDIPPTSQHEHYGTLYLGGH
jgi:hypothetical protein